MSQAEKAKPLQPVLRFAEFNEDWNQDLLANMATFAKGKGYSKSDLTDSGVPVILYGRVYTNYQTVISNVNTFVINTFSSSIKSIGNEVIIPASGETPEDIARASVITQANVIIGGDLNIIYPIPLLHGDFLALTISYGTCQKELSKKAQGKSVVHIRNSDIKELSIKFPQTNKEQTKIGNFFQNLDKQLKLHQDKYRKLTQLKKAMLIKMFPKAGATVPEIRFTGFSGKWFKQLLSDCFTYISNNSLSRAELNDEHGVAKNIHYGDILVKFGEVLDISTTRVPFVSNSALVTKMIPKVLKNGDVLLADAAEDSLVGKCTEIHNLGDEILLAGLHTIAIRPSIEFAPKYLGYLLNSNSYHNQLLPLMQGTKVLSISKSSIKDTFVFYPKDKLEQTKIGEYFHNLDSLINLQQQQIDKLKNIKQACLDKMFV